LELSGVYHEALLPVVQLCSVVSSYFYTVSRAVNSTPFMSNELGTLVVVVLKARNLNDKHTFHKQDVFAQIALNGPTKRTAVDIRGGQNPVWDEEIRISVTKDSSEKNRTLEVSCWEKESKTEDLLGQGKVDIRETLRTGEFDGAGLSIHTLGFD
jgi:Ca2+-dependent lipid-binding protein